MDAKQAVAAARVYFNDLFAGEVGQITLEEVWYEDAKKIWHITFGVHRTSGSGSGKIVVGSLATSYKDVSISDKDGKPLSITMRQLDRV